MAAENVGAALGHKATDMSFNEAAANGRGKRAGSRDGRPGRRGFNEAAANGRGKHGPRKRPHRPPVASMRPRRMAAEN